MSKKLTSSLFKTGDKKSGEHKDDTTYGRIRASFHWLRKRFGAGENPNSPKKKIPVVPSMQSKGKVGHPYSPKKIELCSSMLFGETCRGHKARREDLESHQEESRSHVETPPSSRSPDKLLVDSQELEAGPSLSSPIDDRVPAERLYTRLPLSPTIQSRNLHVSSPAIYSQSETLGQTVEYTDPTPPDSGIGTPVDFAKWDHDDEFLTISSESSGFVFTSRTFVMHRHGRSDIPSSTIPRNTLIPTRLGIFHDIRLREISKVSSMLSNMLRSGDYINSTADDDLRSVSLSDPVEDFNTTTPSLNDWDVIFYRNSEE